MGCLVLGDYIQQGYQDATSQPPGMACLAQLGAFGTDEESTEEAHKAIVARCDAAWRPEAVTSQPLVSLGDPQKCRFAEKARILEDIPESNPSVDFDLLGQLPSDLQAIWMLVFNGLEGKSTEIRMKP